MICDRNMNTLHGTWEDGRLTTLLRVTNGDRMITTVQGEQKVGVQ